MRVSRQGRSEVDGGGEGEKREEQMLLVVQYTVSDGEGLH